MSGATRTWRCAARRLTAMNTTPNQNSTMASPIHGGMSVGRGRSPVASTPSSWPTATGHTEGVQPMNLTEEQRSFRQVMRRFCDERIAPHAAAVDEAGDYPWDNFKACVDMELPALGIPGEHGGSGADHVTQAIMVEELARACAS